MKNCACAAASFIVTEMETITICNEEDDSPEKVETIKQSIRYYRGEKKIFSSDAGWSAFPVVGSWVPCSVNTGSDPVTHVQLFETSHALRLVKDECGPATTPSHKFFLHESLPMPFLSWRSQSFRHKS